MISKIVTKYCELPKPVRRPLWRVWHKMLIRFDKDSTVNFMNYGYEKLNGEKRIELKHHDEKDRYCIQLYDHVVNKVNIEKKDVLEIGSGRGGGASYLARYKSPVSYTALDISSSIINYCNNFHRVKGLQFVKGNAENQPFADQSFDCVVNVESSRCYRSLDKFFSEVNRVLRPGGHFCIADMVNFGEVDKIRQRFLANGFKILNETEITPNVAAALEKDSVRRETEINNKVPGVLKKPFLQFAGAKGSERCDSFSNGKYQYWSFVLQK